MAKRWTKEEESVLFEAIRSGQTVEDVSKTSQRSKNALLARAIRVIIDQRYKLNILEQVNSSWLDNDITIMYGMMPTETTMRSVLLNLRIIRV